MSRFGSDTNAKPKRTRRVASLTASQLERKRACDREAQRTVRAKTKQHINRLEQDLEELRNGLRRDKIIRELIRQNQELKMELSAFRKSTYDSVSSAPRDSGAQMQDFAFQQWNHPMAVSSDSFGGSISESSSRSSSFSLPESTESSTWPAAFPVFPSSSSGHCSGVEDRDNSYSLPGMQMSVSLPTNASTSRGSLTAEDNHGINNPFTQPSLTYTYTLHYS